MSSRSALRGSNRHDGDDPIKRFIRLLAKAIVKRLKQRQDSPAGRGRSRHADTNGR